jgi:hypothetical protein
VKEKQLCMLAAPPETNTDTYQLQNEKIQQVPVIVHFQGPINFPKIYLPLQNSQHKKSDMKHDPY